MSLFHSHKDYVHLCPQIAWALNKGIKSEFKQYWDVELGVTYVPWSKVKMEDLDVFREGGMLDADTLSPGNIYNAQANIYLLPLITNQLHMPNEM